MSASGPPPIPSRRVKPGLSGANPVLPPAPPSRRRRSWLPWVCLGFSLCLFVAVAIVAVRRFRVPTADRQIAVVETPSAPPNSLDDLPPTEVLPETAPDAETETSLPTASTNGEPAAESPKVIPESTPSESPLGATLPMKVEPAEPKNKSDELPPAFADLKRRQFQLTLPGQGLTRELKPVKLADLPVTPPESLELALIADADSGLKLTPSEPGTGEDRSWTVVKNARTNFGGQEAITLGQFSLQSGELRFQWSTTAAEWCKPGSLQLAKLEVAVGQHRQRCRMWKPIELNSVRLNAKENSPVQIPKVAELIDRPETISWQVKLAGLPYEVQVPPAAKVGETVIVTVGEEPAKSVEVQCQLMLKNDRCVLQTEIFGNVQVLDKSGQIRLDRQEISREGIQAKRRTANTKSQSKKPGVASPLSRQLQAKQAEQTRIQNLQSRTTNSNVIAQLEAQSKIIAREIAQLESKIQELQDEQATQTKLSLEQIAWCDAVLQILDALEDRAELRYVVSFQGREPIPVVRTTGFEEQKP